MTTAASVSDQDLRNHYGGTKLGGPVNVYGPGATPGVPGTGSSVYAIGDDGAVISGPGTMAATVTGAQVTQGSRSQATLTFSALTAPYAGTTAAFDASTQIDNSGQNYTGIIRGGMGHVHSGTGAGTIATIEGLAGVIDVQTGFSGTLTGGYGTSGEILHTTGTIGTMRGVNGSISALGAGNIGTGYGGEFYALTTLGQTGTFTTQMAGSWSHIEHANVGTVGQAFGAIGEVLFSAAGTVTNDTQAVRAYWHNSANVTVSGDSYGVYSLFNPTGAPVFTGRAVGIASFVQYDGTQVGGTVNAAYFASAFWNSTANPTTTVYGLDVQMRIAQAITAGNFHGIHVQAPLNSNNPVGITVRGLRIANQGIAGAGNTGEALRIDAQTGAGTNRAIVTGAGLHQFGDALIQGHIPQAINATAAATAAQAASGYITSTSAGPTTITLPTGTLLGQALNAVQGTIHYLTIDNTAGASTVTVAVAVNGILSALAAAEAGGSGLLTIPNGVTGQGTFMLMFSSATAYTFTRVA